MQDPERESAGRAQFVKSARIRLIAPAAGVPHRSGVEAISSSLVAYSAWKMLVRYESSMSVVDLTDACFCTNRSCRIARQTAGRRRVLDYGITENRLCVARVEVCGVGKINIRAA